MEQSTYKEGRHTDINNMGRKFHNEGLLTLIEVDNKLSDEQEVALCNTRGNRARQLYMTHRFV